MNERRGVVTRSMARAQAVAGEEAPEDMFYDAQVALCLPVETGDSRGREHQSQVSVATQMGDAVVSIQQDNRSALYTDHVSRENAGSGQLQVGVASGLYESQPPGHVGQSVVSENMQSILNCVMSLGRKFDDQSNKMQDKIDQVMAMQTISTSETKAEIARLDIKTDETNVRLAMMQEAMLRQESVLPEHIRREVDKVKAEKALN